MEDLEREYLLDSIYLLESETEMEIEFYKPEFATIVVEGLNINYELQ